MVIRLLKKHHRIFKGNTSILATSKNETVVSSACEGSDEAAFGVDDVNNAKAVVEPFIVEMDVEETKTPSVSLTHENINRKVHEATSILAADSNAELFVNNLNYVMMYKQLG